MDTSIQASNTNFQPERKTSRLSTLYFGGIVHVPEDELSRLLQRTPSLKKLRCAIPGPKAYTEPPQLFTHGRAMSAVAKSLEPIQHCLNHLVIRQGRNTDWASYDDSRLDLSQFKSLTTLEAPAECFFRARKADPSRNGVYALLPPTLEELDVSSDLETQATTDHIRSGLLRLRSILHI